jgi:glycosyltransferase involved in cell wall biosynthesis
MGKLMVAAQPSSESRILIVGPVPPPVHGMAVVTASVHEKLAPCGQLVNLSPGSLRRGLAYHLQKSLRVLLALWSLMWCSRGRSVVYLAADANWGLFYSVLLAGLARLRGIGMAIHHHSFAYVNARDRRMSWLTRIAGPAATHLLLCPCMETRFRQLYPWVEQTLVVNNAAFVEPVARSRVAGSRLRVGHLSNLSVEKGLDLVIDSFRELRREMPGATLLLAGPPADHRAGLLLKAAAGEFGNSVRALGPIEGDAKLDFFDQIDVFLFPSRYVNEAQPLVLIEAMRQGVPTIALSRGCIDDLLADGGGRCVARSEEYVDEVLAAVRSWREPSQMAEAASLARRRYAALRSEAEADLRGFFEFLRAGAATRQR